MVLASSHFANETVAFVVFAKAASVVALAGLETKLPHSRSQNHKCSMIADLVVVAAGLAVAVAKGKQIDNELVTTIKYNLYLYDKLSMV